MLELTTDNFYEYIAQQDKPVFVDFWASWCGPCKRLKPYLQEIAAERDDVIIVGLDVEANRRVASGESISAMPTLKLYYAGALLGTMVGAQGKQKFNDFLDDAIGKLDR